MINLDESLDNKNLSPGKLLLQGRLQAGLTQEQVAKELYLTPAKISALEADDYELLGAATFVRGYIRTYSNLLKLDGAKVLAVYEEYLKDNNPQLASTTLVPTANSSYKGAWKFLAFLAAFFIGLWIISVWFLDKPAEKNYVLSTVDVAALPINVDNFPTTSVAQSSVSLSDAQMSSVPSVEEQAQTISTVTSVITTSESARSSVSAISETTVKTAVVKKNELDEINFTFHGECWLEVSDSRGDVLATELQPADSKLILLGKAPFDVKLGNAPVVDIQLNGKKIEVTPLVGNSVLSLQVND